MVQLIFLFVTFIYTELVTANPLMQSIPSCPVTNYQQNIYRQPYSEPIILQPSNIVPYSQHLSIQNPLPVYQPLQVTSLEDQISQIYWEKLLLNPTLRNILDPNNVIYNPTVKEISSNYQNPCNVGRVVNNYIILPPENIKLNETQVTGNSKGSIREHNSTKNGLNNNDSKIVVKSNTQKPRNIKQNSYSKINTNSGNIKCYTPADVLDDRSKVRNNENKNRIEKKNKNLNVQKDKIAAALPTYKSKRTKEKQRNKPRKSSNNEVTKISSKIESSNCKNKILENVTTKVTTQRKSKPTKSISNDSCFKKQNKKLTGEHIARIEPQSKQICYEDVNDIFNLKQDCINLENRRTRNSKTNAASKEPCKMYLDLPDDISRSFAMYINDIYLNPQVSNSNLFSGSNIFPYDFSQIYQIPSNIDMNANANKERTRSSRRKKKSKNKNSKKKQKGETTTNTDDIIKKEKNCIGTEPEIILKTAIEASTPFSSETNNSKSVQKIALSEENINTETENDTTSVYETQILKTVEISNITEGSKSAQYNKMQYYETPIAHTLNSYNYNDIPELLPENEVFNIFDYRLLKDYYPDFTRDNLAYIISREEIDDVNTHNRYFYTTDKNVDSEESSPAYTSREKIIYDEISWNNVIENNEKNYIKENESEEIVFRTPPGLDFPDFTTRKINRVNLDSNELYYQQTDDNDFNRFNFDNHADQSIYSVRTAERYINPNDNKSGSAVETVYARSKVRKYGSGQNTKTPLKTIANDHRIQNDGDKIIVIAKTLGSEDIW